MPLTVAKQEEQNNQPTPEEEFRSALNDVIAIAQKLAQFCNSVDDLIGMADLALNNDSQLRLLMSQVTESKRK